MGLDSIWHWLILLVIVLALFGTKKLSKIGPDLGNALREFKKAMRGDADDEAEEDKKDAGNNESLKADPPPAGPSPADPPAAAPAAASAKHEEPHEAGK